MTTRIKVKKTKTCPQCEHPEHNGRRCERKTRSALSSFAPPCGCEWSTS